MRASFLRLPSGAVVCIAAFAYGCVLSVVSLLKFRYYLTGDDHAIFTQYVWLFGHGANPFNTVNGRFLFADHVEPGLALLAPIGAIGHVAVLLLMLQSFALALVAPLLYLVGRRLGVERMLAGVVPLLWLLSPVVVHPNLYEFHPESLAALAIAASALAAVSERWLPFFTLAALGCSFREDVALLYLGAGLLLVRNGRRGMGLALSAAALVWYVICVLVILPAFGPAVHEDFLRRFSSGRGNTFPALLQYIVVHPLTTVAQMFDSTDLGILALLVLSTAGLCVLAPSWLLLAAPQLLLNFLSADPDQHTLVFHYYVVPFTGVALAGVAGAKRLQVRGWHRPMLRFAVVCGVFLALLSLGVLDQARKDISDAKALKASRDAAVAAVPAGRPVSVTINLSPHFAERRDIYLLSESLVPWLVGSTWNAPQRRARARSVRYAVLDRTGEFDNRTYEGHLAELRAAGFHPIFRRGPLTVYHR